MLPLFPENITTFIDMFMGSGAVTFAMVDRAKYVIANDNDEDIFNLFMVVKERKEELFNAICMMPVHESLFKRWKQTEEKDPIWKAARFLMFSEMSCWGAGNTIFFSAGTKKDCIYKKIEAGFKKIQEIQFMSCDFRDMLSKLFTSLATDKNTFWYADPPYIGTGNNYAESFTEDDTRDLFSILISSGLRFAVSEFRHPLVMALAEEHGLHVTSLGERRNLKNRREEILITNYQPERRQGSLFPAMGMAASPANNLFNRTPTAAPVNRVLDP